ncbi:CotS family spore coat protein [uncultured Clostridium sp.]|uniref:CotS family spore coat protein n=1 Tax=uncultured Clostridium sp. TaxID=59620 RepID=UPI002613B1C0|nr:CotS family spore coat protein [uncultured Clostridium sp.]
MKKLSSKTPSIFAEETIRQKVLSYYGLEHATIKVIKAKDTDKQRVVYKITYKNRSYCLKKVYFNEENLLFVYSALEWLFKNNINTPKLLNTLEGDKYVSLDGMLFILTIWIDGTKCNSNQTNHIIAAVKQLSYVHKSSKNFIPIKGSKKREGFTDIYITTLKHFNQILLSYNCAIKCNDIFSETFLEFFDMYLEISKFSLELSSRVNHDNLSRSLCHGDYVSKNLIFDRMDNIWLIDLDKCKLEYSMNDFGYFLRRLLRREKTAWNVELTLRLFREYNTFNKMTIDDFRYLISYISFPQKYWKISKDYFKNRKKCNEEFFLDTILKSGDKISAHIDFIRTIQSRVENEYNLKL